MSVENVRAFFGQVESDKTLQGHIWSLHKKAQENLAAAVADLVEIAAAAGFAFTADEYAVVRAQHVPVPATVALADPDQALECCNSGWSCCRVKTM